jgi:hypothetical protein
MSALPASRLRIPEDSEFHTYEVQNRKSCNILLLQAEAVQIFPFSRFMNLFVGT